MLWALISASNGEQFKEIHFFFFPCPFCHLEMYTNGPVTEHVHIGLSVRERERVNWVVFAKAIKYLALKDIFYALFSRSTWEKKNCIKTKRRLFKIDTCVQEFRARSVILAHFSAAYPSTAHRQWFMRSKSAF
jgi:hypothetical protein